MEENTAGNYFREQVKKPGLFICLDKNAAWPEAELFIQKILQEFPELQVLIYYSREKPDFKPETSHLLVADKRDFTLFGKEKKPLKQWLSKHRFDLLLVFSKTGDKRCKRLTTSIKAKLKAGHCPAGETPWINITIDKPDAPLSYEMFYEQLKIYFKQLNIKLLP